MKKTSYFKVDMYLSLVNWIGIPLIGAYLIGMLFWPLFTHCWSWEYTQDVWDRWQTLNAGMLAFVASVIALNISSYNEDKQRKRRFIATRAFLPEALSEVSLYLKNSAEILKESWEKLNGPRMGLYIPLQSPFAEQPEGYREIFSKCIIEAEPEIGDYLAKILSSLQIHHARMRELQASFSPDRQLVIVQDNLKSYLYSLAEIKAMINSLYGFARGEEPFSGPNLSEGDFKQAYANLDIYPEDYPDLEGFTKRVIDRRYSSSE